MSRTYRPSDHNPQWLLSPSVQERLPENDLAYFMLELVDPAIRLAGMYPPLPKSTNKMNVPIRSS